MRPFVLYMVITAGLLLFCLICAFRRGLGAAMKSLLTLVLALVLSGFSMRLGGWLVPQLRSFLAVVAGAVGIFFYSLIKGLLRDSGSRFYRPVSSVSRFFACVLALAEVWILSSLLLFYFRIFVPVDFPSILKVVGRILELPLRFFWL